MDQKVFSIVAVKVQDLKDDLQDRKRNAPAEDNSKRCFRYYEIIKSIADEANCLRQILRSCLREFDGNEELERVHASVEDVEKEAINEYMFYEGLISEQLKSVPGR